MILIILVMVYFMSQFYFLKSIQLMIVHITIETSSVNICTHRTVIHYWELNLWSVIQQDFVKINISLI